MTIALTITYGSTTVDLNSTSCSLKYGSWAPEVSEEETVTESIPLEIFGASLAAIQATIAGIELALHKVKEYQAMRSSDPVYINLTLTGGSAQRSELVDGRLMLESQSIAEIERNLHARANLAITRANWWEGALTTLQVTNRSGTGATGAVVNHQDADATDDFYLEIAAAQVGGVVATPAVISYQNTVNDATLVDEIRVGHFATSGANAQPAASALILEGSGSADAGCSGGAYAALSWADDAENSLATWTLASGAFRQRNYKAVARLQAATEYTDLFLKAKLMSGTLVLAETRWTQVSAGPILVEIGTLQIPPFRFGAHVDLGNLTVALYEKRASGAGDLDLDFIALMPQDSWRKLEAVSGTGLAYNETAIDDPIQRMLTTLYGSSYKVTQMVAEGEPVMLQPGVTNVLYFLASETTGAAPIARTATVTVKARMRKRTV